MAAKWFNSLDTNSNQFAYGISSMVGQNMLDFFAQTQPMKLGIVFCECKYIMSSWQKLGPIYK